MHGLGKADDEPGEDGRLDRLLQDEGGHTKVPDHYDRVDRSGPHRQQFFHGRFGQLLAGPRWALASDDGVEPRGPRSLGRRRKFEHQWTARAGITSANAIADFSLSHDPCASVEEVNPVPRGRSPARDSPPEVARVRSGCPGPPLLGQRLKGAEELLGESRALPRALVERVAQSAALRTWHFRTAPGAVKDHSGMSAVAYIERFGASRFGPESFDTRARDLPMGPGAPARWTLGGGGGGTTNPCTGDHPRRFGADRFHGFRAGTSRPPSRSPRFRDPASRGSRLPLP